VAANYLAQGLKSLESSDTLYLYILTQNAQLYPVVGLPGGEREAAAAGGAPWTRDAKTLLDNAVGKVFQLRSLTMDIDTRVRATYRSLEEVASLLAGIPERKNIVWVTHGVPIEIGPGASGAAWPIDYTPLLRRLTLAMDRANVAVYPVMQATPGMAAGSPEAQYSGLGSQDTLQQMADLTGGPSRTTNSIGEVVRQAMNDTRTSYQIGYYPPAENWDGKFHKLRVTCKRKGVRIQAKTGYYAWLDQASDEQDALDAAVAPAFDASEIGMRGTQSASPKGAGTVRFALRIDPSDVRIAQQGERSVAHLDLQVVAYSGNGAGERSAADAVNLNWSAEELADVRRYGILLSKDIQLGDNVERVRFLVFDRDSHAIGTLTFPVTAGK
jgi:VWFA-related protein